MSALESLKHYNGIEEDPGGAYVYHDDVGPLIAELEAEKQEQIERREEEKLRAVLAEAALTLSREQTEYANDAMMAMCKRAEKAEDRCKELAEEAADRIGALNQAEAELAALWESHSKYHPSCEDCGDSVEAERSTE